MNFKLVLSGPEGGQISQNRVFRLIVNKFLITKINLNIRKNYMKYIVYEI